MSRGFEQDTQALGKILAAIPEFILVLDRTGKILYINHVDEGYDRDSVIGTQAHEIMSPDSRKVLSSVLASVFESGTEQHYDSKVNAPDGTVQWYRSRMYPIRDDGQIVAVMLLATNITEMKATEDMLQAEQRTSRQLRRLLPICSWCERIRNDEGEWETVESYLSREADADVSHSLCPDCYRRETADMGIDDDSGSDDEGEAGPTAG